MNGVIAIVPWGDVIEDFLDPIGLTVFDFAREMSGGWLFGYVEALRCAGWSPIILAPSSTVKEINRLDHAGTGVPIWLVPGRSRQSLTSPNLRSLSQWLTTPVAAIRRVLQQEGCRALLIQEYERPQFDALVAVAQSMRMPVFATFQGGDLTLSAVERLIRRRSLAHASGLIIASSAERERVRATYRLDRARIASVPNPLDLHEWQAMPRAQARAALGIPDERFVAVTHGRIDIHRKGLDVLLAAWSGPGELILIGSGQDRDRFGAMVSGRSDVRWIDGYTNDRQLIRRWLSAADVYVSASRIEGMPVAPLEAMACGLPVIASRAKGLEDILSGDGSPGGVLVPVGNASALSSAIAQLRTDPALRSRLGQRARTIVEERFSIPVVARDLNSFLTASAPRVRGADSPDRRHASRQQ